MHGSSFFLPLYSFCDKVKMYNCVIKRKFFEPERDCTMSLGYYNGKIGIAEEMTIPMLDRAVYFGDGVYEATLVKNKVPYDLEAHFNRFWRSLAKVRIDPGFTRDEFKAEIYRFLDMLEDDGCYMLYWQMSRGTAPRTHLFPDPPVKPNLLMTLTKKPMPQLEHQVKLMTQEDIRFLMCDVKTLNLLPAVLAGQLAKDNGCDEVVFHRGGSVTESFHSNLSILKNGVLITHQADNLVLHGIIRALLLKVCGELGIPTEERPLTVDELRDADEVIITASTSYCSRGIELDGRPLPMRDGDTFRKLQQKCIDHLIEDTSARI